MAPMIPANMLRLWRKISVFFFRLYFCVSEIAAYHYEHVNYCGPTETVQPNSRLTAGSKRVRSYYAVPAWPTNREPTEGNTQPRPTLFATPIARNMVNQTVRQTIRSTTSIAWRKDRTVPCVLSPSWTASKWFGWLDVRQSDTVQVLNVASDADLCYPWFVGIEKENPMDKKKERINNSVQNVICVTNLSTCYGCVVASG